MRLTKEQLIDIRAALDIECELDGNAYSATLPGFVDMMESACGYGATKDEATVALLTEVLTGPLRPSFRKPVRELKQEDVILIGDSGAEVIDDREFEVWAPMPANPITLQCPPIGGEGEVLRQDVSLEFLEAMFPNGVLVRPRYVPEGKAEEVKP